MSRRVVRQPEGARAELHPLETRVHWYASAGCATEQPSDCLLTCACELGGGLCAGEACSAEQIVARCVSCRLCPSV